jgi:thiol-disulfide isomerase/thioredoxin
MTNDLVHNQASPVAPSRWGTWITIAVGAVLTLIWLMYLKPHIQLQDALNQPGVGQLLPALELQPLTGATEGMSLENIHGKVALINFWGPWCGFCLDEFPHLLELWDKNRGNPDFAFISVSASEGGPSHEDVPKLRAETEKFLKSREATFPTYVDSDNVTRRMLSTATDMDGFGYPTTILLDRGGKIRALWLGYQPGFDQQMEQLVSQLLAEKPTTGKEPAETGKPGEGVRIQETQRTASR